MCVYIYMMSYMYANREEAYKRGYIYTEAKRSAIITESADGCGQSKSLVM